MDIIVDKHPLVSVITPCFNDGRYLQETVESVAASSYPNIEHIIVNDGSTDSLTLELLDTLSSKVHVIHSPNQGVCKARNLGINQSNGTYILPVDGDDLISVDYIEKAVEKLECNSGVRVVAVNYEMFGRFNSQFVLEPYSLDKLLGHNLFTVTSMFRREDFDRVGGFNENMWMGLEDWDFWLSLLEKGGVVEYLEGFHFKYRIKKKKSSRNASITKEQFQQIRCLVWKNHRELYSQRFLDPTVCFEYIEITNSFEYKLGSLLVKIYQKLRP